MLENGENRQITFIFPFKNLKTEEKKQHPDQKTAVDWDGWLQE